MVKYETGIPLPGKVIPKRPLSGLTKALIDCPVGASFFVPGKSPAKLGAYVKSARWITREQWRQYASRTVTEGGVKGARVCRLK
jgi:hypothetical protein